MAKNPIISSILLSMSSPSLPSSTSISSSASAADDYPNLGIGYAIAVALGFLVVLSTLLLSSYICCRASRYRSSFSTSDNSTPSHSEGIILPQAILIPVDDNRPDRDFENVVLGLDQHVINSYPKFPYSKEAKTTTSSSNLTCSICLCEYKERETMRMMPECRHFFHLGCIDAWLKLNASCPVCRNSPLQTPLSTPLQEVVPLSRYMADQRGRR